MTPREQMEAAVRRELVGPAEGEAPRGKPLTTTGGTVAFASWSEARGPWHDAETGEEILSEIEPLRRYGIGVLHPQGTPVAESIIGVPGLPTDDDISDSTPSGQPQGTSGTSPESDDYDFDLSDANSYKPSAMAISFKVAGEPEGWITVDASASAYEKFPVHVEGKLRNWYVRRPVSVSSSISLSDLSLHAGQVVSLPAKHAGYALVKPQIQVYSRPVPGEPSQAGMLVTVALVNTATEGSSVHALFQAALAVKPQGSARIDPYPELPAPGGTDQEAESIALLYRKKATYAVGHGCAAGWEEPTGGTTTGVRAETLPAYEVPSMTADITWGSGSGEHEALKVSMASLAEEGGANGRQQVNKVIELYEQWINEREREVAGLSQEHQPAARRHMDSCRAALQRMREGWRLVQEDELAATAFRLGNQAMLYQQIRSRLPVRGVSVSEKGLLQFEGPRPEAVPTSRTGNWRPFQIAFILACLPEIVYPGDSNRDLVDLIFFPTGGGKTEAYLGAAAISMIARRLRDRGDAGTEVLMRYTLRLLTAQQFLRAAALMCVLEDIRSHTPALGNDPFSIGIWLGSATTPNNRRQAIEALRKLQTRERSENPFLLLRCPWCGTRMGPVGGSRRREIAGYIRTGGKIKFRCPDSSCRFGGRSGLPILVVDEDIYEEPPTLLIGTVDKFATLAWDPRARSLFGLSPTGERRQSPPGFIIQDELHLISGPLGSMVGLYEPLIEDLCTDHRFDPPVLPKMVASTATIRQYEQQVRDLYGRSRVALFPPQGLEEGRSFFAEPATLGSGGLAPGRRYLGVMSPSLGSIQTVQVRVAAATLQTGLTIEGDGRDGYWTNLNFLNSLRELGNTVSLLQSDIPDYLTGMWKRDGIDPKSVRWPRNILELTSRRRTDEIPRAIEELSLTVNDPRCVDVCLASNIIEVGVDIDRLSLMTIVGQPKTTAQYIQVSGRVGRRWEDRPGLVITIFGAAKPRDRSHYERFRSYHQRLYAQVEPTTLTPFALPVLQRGLHGAVVSHVRQAAASDLPVYPFPRTRFDDAVGLLAHRAEIADGAELAALHEVARQRARQWGSWERTEWSADPWGGDPKQGLMRSAGSSPDPESKVPVWEVPRSMRNVDMECVLSITDAYAVEAGTSDDDEGGQSE